MRRLTSPVAYLLGLLILVGAVFYQVPRAATALQSGIAWITTGKMVWSDTAPTLAGNWGTSPSIASSNGATTFRINVGTGGSASSGTVGMPTASNGWNCLVHDTTGYPLSLRTIQTSNTAGGVTFTSINTNGVATAWVSGSILSVICAAY